MRLYKSGFMFFILTVCFPEFQNLEFFRRIHKSAKRSRFIRKGFKNGNMFEKSCQSWNFTQIYLKNWSLSYRSKAKRMRPSFGNFPFGPLKFLIFFSFFSLHGSGVFFHFRLLLNFWSLNFHRLLLHRCCGHEFLYVRGVPAWTWNPEVCGRFFGKIRQDVPSHL